MKPTFPVLQVSGDSILAFSDEASFRHMVSLATDKAIKDGFFEHAQIVDSGLRLYRVREIRLSGRASLLGWLKRGRQIEVLDVRAEDTELALAELKQLIAEIIRRSDYWSENEDVEGMTRDIEQAMSFEMLVALFV